MATPHGWDNPLTRLGPIADHPTLSPDDSPLSSAPSSPHRYGELQEKCSQILRDYRPENPNDDTAGILGAFLQHLSKQGQMTLMKEIEEFDGQQLRQLRNFLVHAILKPMKTAGGKTPTIPASPYRAEAEEVQAIMGEITPSSRGDQSMLKAKCLTRDGDQCILTHWNDPTKVPLGPNRRLASTEAAHILPFALRSFDERLAVDTENKARIWWALYRYFPYITGKIDPGTINKPENVVTLATMVHQNFGRFDLALEPLDTGDNKYRLHWLVEGFVLADLLPKHITLEQHDPSVPMPDPAFLRVHFQVAQILAVSGIGRRVEEAYEEESRGPANLAPDGSTDIERILNLKMLLHI